MGLAVESETNLKSASGRMREAQESEFPPRGDVSMT